MKVDDDWCCGYNILMVRVQEEIIIIKSAIKNRTNQTMSLCDENERQKSLVGREFKC